MKKILLILLSISIVGYVSAQNLRFSYEVTNPDVANNQSLLTVYVEKSGGGTENISGFNYGFYYKSTEATIQGQAAGFLSNNMTGAQLALCVVTDPAVDLGWVPDITGSVVAVTTPPVGVPSGYDRLFTGAMVDGNGAGTDVGAKVPIVALLLDNTVGGAPIVTDSAYLGASDTNPAWEYSNINFEGFPVIAIGVRLETLPIELVSFKAQKFNEKSSFLSWSTSTEINSSHFVVQRSFDKKNWSAVGNVAAAGNSQIINNYTLVDQNVYNGVDSRRNVYYRLQMFDLDGKSKLSPIETVVFTNSGNTDTYQKFTLYPNPASEGVQIEWDANAGEQPTSFEFYDVTGKLIHTQKLSDQTNQEYVDFQYTNIKSGIYLVRIMNGTESLEIKQVVVGHNR